MNLRQVFVSVLLFGVAGLLLFMYLQAWIEEQHTGTLSFLSLFFFLGNYIYYFKMTVKSVEDSWGWSPTPLAIEGH